MDVEDSKYQISESYVRYFVNEALGEDDREKPVSYSLYRSYLEWMVEAASKYASEKPDIDEYGFKHLLNDGLRVVSNLRLNMLEAGWKDKTLNFWDSNARPIDKIKSGKVPHIDRSGMESVVGEYLALPYRSQPMDRILVRILVATELYSYGDEMLNEKTSVSNRRHGINSA